MDQKKIILRLNSISCIFLFLFNINSIAQEPVNLGNRNMQLRLENKNEILEWGKNEFGYYGDTLSLNIESGELFFLLANYSFSGRYQTLFIFLKDEWNKSKIETKEFWKLICTLDTKTVIDIEFDDKNENILIKSKSGDVLMILPIKALSLYY